MITNYGNYKRFFFASSACEIAELISPSFNAANAASTRFSASSRLDLPSRDSSALRSNFLAVSLSPVFNALIASSIDCTVGLSDWDVELFTCVELEDEIVVLVPNVTSEELLWAYETIPFENNNYNLAIQKEIVKKLDTIFSTIELLKENRGKQLSKFDDLSNSILYKTFNNSIRNWWRGVYGKINFKYV